MNKRRIVLQVILVVCALLQGWSGFSHLMADRSDLYGWSQVVVGVLLMAGVVEAWLIARRLRIKHTTTSC